MARYALVIGITVNDASLGTLEHPLADARAIAQVLQTYGDFRVEVLTSPEETCCAAIAAKLKEFFLVRALRQEALLFYSGHGFPLMDSFGEVEAFLAPADCVVEWGADGKAIAQRNGLALRSVSALAARAELSNLVMLLDCCHSGYLLEEALLKQTFASFIQKDYWLMTACRSFESAYAKRSDQYSLFTGAVLAGLAADRADDLGAISVSELFAFIPKALKGEPQEVMQLAIGRPIDLVRYSLTRVATTLDETNPYQGLFAFTDKTARFFFGRDSVVQDLIRKLQESSFVPLIGASGSGKSSVVRAGLVVRLRELGWVVLEPMKPGVDPIHELKRSLGLVFERRRLPEIHRLIDLEGLQGILSELPNQNHLLVVDQFEEVFTLSDDRSKQRRFIEMLVGLAVGDRLSIVTTMRSDFVENWQEHHDLVETLRDHTVWMPPLEGKNLRDAIVKPAEVQGYVFETELEELILEDVEAERNCLPLLEFALEKLWNQCNESTHQLTVLQYRGMGRLMGALNQYATDWYEKLTAHQRILVQRIMLELVRIGVELKDTRWRRQREEVVALGSGIDEMIDQLADQRLIVIEGETIDLAHERLMDGWELFAYWKLQNRDLRRLSQRVTDAYQEWTDQDEDEDFLLKSGLLKQAKNHWLQIYPTLITESIAIFYDLSIEAEHKQTSYHESINNFKQGLSSIQTSLSQRLLSIEDIMSEELSEVSKKSINKDLINQIQQEITGFMDRTRIFEERMNISRKMSDWIEENHDNIISFIVREISSSQEFISLDQNRLDTHYLLLKKESRKLLNWIKKCLVAGQTTTENLPELSGEIPKELYINALNLMKNIEEMKSLKEVETLEIFQYIKYLVNALIYIL